MYWAMNLCFVSHLGFVISTKMAEDNHLMINETYTCVHMVQLFEGKTDPDGYKSMEIGHRAGR